MELLYGDKEEVRTKGVIMSRRNTNETVEEYDTQRMGLYTFMNWMKKMKIF